MFSLIKKIDVYYSKFIESMLVVNVMILILLATYSIIARWIQITNLWVDPLNRHLVLLLIFLGSTVAIDKKKHLKIDALTLSIENKISPFIHAMIELVILTVVSVIIFFLYRSGVHFWKSELEFPVDAFLNLKQYHLAVIIPLGFFLMLLKYGLQILLLIPVLLSANTSAATSKPEKLPS